MVVAVVGFFIWLSATQDDSPDFDRNPHSAYREQMKETLAGFDSEGRVTFDALYPYTPSQLRDHVWDACSAISPHGRTTKVVTYPASPFGVGDILSGTAKADSSKRLSCQFELDPSVQAGSWDISLTAP
ncbi:hypothetical protein [Leifsonia sp. SIMBA_070]|uniref:hypothetical protein n=1 Tax=Leifsonia sp. SIMBA_070 TaxID=3085810 RepID=UPI00397D6CEE